MRLPSGEKLGEVSTPGALVSRCGEAAVGVDDVDVGVAADRHGKDDPAAVGREARGEGDCAAGDEQALAAGGDVDHEHARLAGEGSDIDQAICRVGQKRGVVTVASGLGQIAVIGAVRIHDRDALDRRVLGPVSAT